MGNKCSVAVMCGMIVIRYSPSRWKPEAVVLETPRKSSGAQRSHRGSFVGRAECLGGVLKFVRTSGGKEVTFGTWSLNVPREAFLFFVLATLE